MEEEQEPLHVAEDDDKKTKESKPSTDRSEFTTEGINLCYVVTLLLVVSLGTIQFGYMIGSWNAASAAYAKKEGWDEEEASTKIMIVQSVTTAGAAVGSLFSGFLSGLGRWNCIMIANAILVVGVGLTLVDDFVVMCVGRPFYGFAVGNFSVYCPKFIAETAPIEIKGPAGALTQISITFGILIAFTVGLGIGDVDEDDQDSFQIQDYWYILFALPLLLAVIQVLLLVFAFNYDTPVVMKKQGEVAKLKELMNKIYTTEEKAQERSDLIAVDVGGQQEELSYSKLCCHPKYRRATLVGCTLLVFQQLTGINVIMFYSNMLFKGFEMSATTVTALIGIVNFVTTLFGLLFLACAGRKIIMLIFNGAMALTLYMLAVFAYQRNTWGMVICVLLFISFFEFSSGPICWLYAAEIMQDKAVSIGTFLNWSLSLAISISIPLLVKRVPLGTIFLALGVFTTLGTLFIVFFMKETRGKTQEEIDAMFDDEEEEENYDRMAD